MTLHAGTIYGILRGLETLSQMILFDFENESYVLKNAPWNIIDAPRFPHRGLMIDTSRHFLPLYHIRRVIDSIAYAKMNVLHWHMGDNPSFPLQIQSHPTLWNGSFSSQERYLQSDIAQVVEYARDRGVRVMLEIDVPGHGKSWCKGLTATMPINGVYNTP